MAHRPWVLSAISCSVSLLVVQAQIAAAQTTEPAAKAKPTNPLIPLEDFFKNPQFLRAILSPDGTRLAYLKPFKDRLNIFVKDLASGKEKQITRITERDIRDFFWPNDEQIAFLQDKAGDENFHLYLADLKTATASDVTPFEKTRVDVIDDLRDDDDHMLITTNKRDAKVFDAYRINLKTKELTLVAQNPGNIESWIADHEGKIRAATTTDGVNSSLLFRQSEKEEFKAILTNNFKTSVMPIGFTFDNKNLYVLSNAGRDKTALVVMDPKSSKETKEIYANKDYDLSGALFSEKQKKLVAASYVGWKQSYEYFDAERKAMQEFLNSKLPGVEVRISGSDEAERRFVIRTMSDKTLGSYYLFDKEAKTLEKIADLSPWFEGKKLADMKPVAYKARDGLTINGYLVLPPGQSARNLPVIINVHGGPWTRDVWGFDSEAQFLANRGYAVLQMNYRGSTGYGREFWEKSFKQWGQAMQNDVTDGAHWLVSEGIADAGRICIYGGSYGGYAALAGLAFTPDTYACGIDYVGVSNLLTFLNTIPPYWENARKMMHEMIGDPVKDKAMMQKFSPYFHAAKIKAPLFIAQGANDPRVNKAESDQMVESMTKAGRTVDYMVKDNEGHGFHNQENRFDFYRRMESFLAKHLPQKAVRG